MLSTSGAVLSVLLSAFVLPSSGLPSPDASSSERLETRAASYYPVTGVKGSGVQVRRDIRDLQANYPDQWNLYLIGLSRLQAMDQQDKTSYYQLAGIHGYPHIPWDGVTGDGDYGYCPHRSNLFGPWHRPYIVLYEQVLSAKISEIVNELPAGTAKQRYTQAASAFRVPYWDWSKKLATNEIHIPESMRAKTIAVTFPNGTASTIKNPLFKYDFHPMNLTEIPLTEFVGTFRYKMYSLNFTFRYASGNVDEGTIDSNNDGLATTYSNEVPRWRTALTKMFSQYQTFHSFSWDGSRSRIGTLEEHHNLIHARADLGHMNPSSLAAFDPMFWLHHANVDRYMAIFQAIFSDTWVIDSTQELATYTIPAGSTQGPDSPLTPFRRNAAGDLHTSNTVRNISALGYTYPELADSPSNSTLIARIKALYDDTVTSSSSSSSSSSRRQTPAAVLAARDYLAQISIPAAALSGPYSVAVFLGDASAIPADPAKWSSSAEYLGSVATFGMGGGVTTGSVDLGQALVGRHQVGELADLEEETVVAYLKEKLHWKAQQGAERGPVEVEKSRIGGARVGLVSTAVERAGGEGDFDTWVGEFTEHADIA